MFIVDLPNFELKIQDEGEQEVSAIALVDYPAIERDFQYFGKSEQFAVQNEERRMIAGFAMIPNMPIYRRDKTGEYNVFFSKETVTQIMQRYMRDKKQDQTNTMHSDFFVNDVYIVESFQIDSERGILTPKGFEEAPDGSWFISMKVDNDKIWNDFIKTGKFKGFSIEGIFEHERVDKFNMNTEKQNSLLEKVTAIYDSIFSKGAEVEETELNADEIANAPVVEMAQAPLADGTLIMWDGELMVGTVIRVVTEDGEVDAPDGSHELADGSAVIVTEGGKVVEVIENTEEVVEEDVVEEEPVDEMATLRKDFEMQKSEFEALEGDYKTLEEKLKNVEAEKAEAFEALEKANELVAKFKQVETPKPEPTPIVRQTMKEKLLSKTK